MHTTFILLINPSFIPWIIKVWIESGLAGNWQFCKSEKNEGNAVAIITVSKGDYVEIKSIQNIVNKFHCQLSSKDGEQLMTYSGKFKEV